MKNISESIARTLGNQGIISGEDVDNCRYGLDVFISSVLEIISILIISAAVGNFVETILFFVAFVPLRVYAGGYHADTKLRCYLVSLCVYAVFTIIMNFLPKEFYFVVNLTVTLISVILTLVSAPVIHKNKKINETERKYYRKFSIYICLVETTIILLLTVIFPMSSFAASLAFGQAAVTASMIASVIKRKITDNKQSSFHNKGGVTR